MKAIYVRVSTDEQRDKGHSIHAQTQFGIAYITKEYGPECEYILFDDAGYSAKDIQTRPALKQVLQLMEQQLIDELIFHHIDRLAREVMDLYYIFKHAKLYEIKLTCLSSDVTMDTPEQFMFVMMQAVFAQFEREKIAQRTKNGIVGGLKKGQYSIGGLPPYGYKRLYNKIVIDVKAAAIVHKIYSLYTKYNFSINQIHEHLSKHRLDPNRKFYFNEIKRILTDTRYIGNYRHNSGDYNIFPRIIGDEIFEVAQNRLNNSGKVRKNVYIFKDTVYCIHCKKPLAGVVTNKKERKFFYYSCLQHTCIAYKKRLNEQKVVDHCSDTLLNLYDNHRYNDVQKQLIQERNEKIYKQFNKDIVDRTKKLDYLSSLLIDKTIDSNTYKKQRDIILREIEHFNTEAELLSRSLKLYEVPFASATREVQQQLIQRHIPKIYIDLVAKKIPSVLKTDKVIIK